MRAFTAAAVQVAPVPGPLTAESVAANLDKLRRLHPPVRRGHRGRARRAARVGDDRLHARLLRRRSSGSSSSELPGPVIEPLRDVAAELGIHLVAGTYERGPSPEIVYNASVLIDPRGELLGVYRKTHPFCSEAVSGGGWVTPGDTVTVCDTELGRIGMIICFDGDYPELSRIQAVQGAEVICRPSALLRSADIWELTSRARAYDNHVFVVGANAVGQRPGRGALLRQLAHRHARSGTSSPRPRPTRAGSRPGSTPTRRSRR